MSTAREIEHESTAVAQRMERMPQTAETITPMTMIDRALMSGADPDTLSKLLALQERWEANQGRKAFDEAMAAAKSEIPTINKNREVGYEHKDGSGKTSYRHEDLGEIARVVTPILARHGLSYRFRTTSEVNQPISVTCIVSHRDGHSEENTLIAGADNSGKKNSIQAIGSTITYLQRYTLKAALGLAAADDDDGKKSDADELASEDQVIALREMIEGCDADMAKFCRRWKIEVLSDLPAKQFDDAMASLRAFANHQAQGSKSRG